MPGESGSPRPETLEALVERAQRGDAEALETLFAAHQRLIWHVLRRLSHPGRDTEDLYQVGAVGLMKAIHRFDTRRGVQFATYAVPLILGEVRRYLRDDQPVHVARSLRDRGRQVAEVRARLAQALGRDPGPQDLAQALGWDVADVVEALESQQAVGSLDAAGFGERGKDAVADTEKTDAEAEWVGRLALDEALARLTARERLVLRWRYEDGETQSRVAERLGISQVQVSRLERQALERLRQQLTTDSPH
jgi:RNA polymerase sporulation-specific sigma factor